MTIPIKGGCFAFGTTNSELPRRAFDSTTLPLPFTSIDNQLPPSFLPHPIINAITVPPKIWRKKAATKYKPIIYDDVDEDLYLFKSFGKCVKHSSSWQPRLRSDLIHWNESLDSPELERDFRIGDQVDGVTRRSVLSIIKSNWDSFCERGVSRPVLDFEFCIDTGDSDPVCCRQPSYGYHERKIMNQHISALEDSGLIVDCEGPWGSLLVLAPKPHQEDCSSIDDFIWRLCVSYRPLNIVTRSFEYPIPRCADSIEDIGNSCGKLMIISLDTRSGYH